MSVAAPDATESSRRLRMSGSRNAVAASAKAVCPKSSETESLPRSGRRRRLVRSATASALPEAAGTAGEAPGATAACEAPVETSRRRTAGFVSRLANRRTSGSGGRRAREDASSEQPFIAIPKCRFLFV